MVASGYSRCGSMFEESQQAGKWVVLSTVNVPIKRGGCLEDIIHSNMVALP